MTKLFSAGELDNKYHTVNSDSNRSMESESTISTSSRSEENVVNASVADINQAKNAAMYGDNAIENNENDMEKTDDGSPESAVPVDAPLDPVACLWSTIYQICSIVAVENLDEGLSMPSVLIATTKDLMAAMPLSFGMLGIVDLVIYTILVEWSEKRSFHMTKKPIEGTAEATQEDEDEEDDDEEVEDSPLAEYCLFLQQDVVPILNAKFTNNGIQSLVVKLVDEMFSSSCRFSVQFDPNFIPLTQFISMNTPSGPIIALADRTMHDMYGTLCGDHPAPETDKSSGASGTNSNSNSNSAKSNGRMDGQVNGHLDYAAWQHVVGESCKTIEDRVRTKFPAAMVVPYGSTVIPGTSTNQSDVDMLLVCSDIVHDNELHWKAKEEIEDQYIALVEEGKQEYNRYATEVSANKLLEKCVRNIQDYLARHEQQMIQYNSQYAQYQQYIMMQQQQYQQYGNRRPVMGAPPMPAKLTGIALFFTAEDMQMLSTVVLQGHRLMEGVIPQTRLYQSYMGLIVDYFEDLSILFGRYLGKTDPKRKEYENQVALNNNKTLYSVKYVLESLVVPGADSGHRGRDSGLDSRHWLSMKNGNSTASSSSNNASGSSSVGTSKHGSSAGYGTGTSDHSSSESVNGGGSDIDVRCISNLRLNLHGSHAIHFTDHITNRKVKLEINHLINIKSSELIKAYLDMDKSGVVRKYVSLVKIFAQAHKVCSASDGYLSSYSWTLMALHVLLRYRLIPCITPQALSAQHFCKGVDVSYVDSLSQLPVAFESRLRQIGLMQLLHLFFHYYSRVFDIESEVVSLRRPTMPKLSQFGSRLHAQSWRFSIEDPFQTADSLFPLDLGASLVNYTKQANIFKLINLGRKGIEISMQKSTIGYNGTINFLRSGLESVFDATSIDRWQYA